MSSCQPASPPYVPDHTEQRSQHDANPIGLCKIDRLELPRPEGTRKIYVVVTPGGMMSVPLPRQ